MSTHSLPNTLAYEHHLPSLAGPPRAAREGHVLIGRVSLGYEPWLGAGSVIRADGQEVSAGDRLQLGRASTVHIAHPTTATRMGHRVTVGANAVVHACTLGDDVVIEDGVVILDGAVLGAGVVVEAGSVVFPRASLDAGWLYAGRPARPIRPLDLGEAAQRALQLQALNEAADGRWPTAPRAASAEADAFIASTSLLNGDVRMGAAASIWFGCRLDAREAPIVLGRRSNVQDNSVMAAGSQGCWLGEESTIGHNVSLDSCRIGARCLVGMGSHISRGTVIADDTFVAAGCVTEPGQHLDGGLVWGGQPARPLGPMDDKKRQAVLRTASVYVDYARAMRR